MTRSDPVSSGVSTGCQAPGRAGRRRASTAPAAPLAVLPAVLLAVLLAGCAGIPKSGPVVVGRPVGEAPRALLRISGTLPEPGASPEEIVRGFLRATADITDDHNVARRFLTGPRQDTWRADSSVVIYAGDSQLDSVRSSASVKADGGQPAVTPTGTARLGPARTPTTDADAGVGTVNPRGSSSAETGAGSVTAPPRPAEDERAMVSVRVPVTARVDNAGEYRICGPGDVERRVFGLVVRGGEWRIDGLSDGSLLTKADFDTTYSNLPVYFPDPTGGWLVPDVRWFPVGGATATVLVKAVLAGPSPWLAGAVTTGAPAGTRLTASSVPIRLGVAVVDLTGPARQADPVHRQMLRAQLLSTLSVLPMISPTQLNTVTITVESKTFDIPRASDLAAESGRPGEPSPRLLTDPVVDGAPLVVDRGRLMRLTGRQLTAVEGLAELSGPAVSWPAIATDGSAYAALIGGSQLRYSVGPGAAATLVTGLGQLTPPSFDPLGWVWTASRSGTSVRAGRPDLGTVSVPTTHWPAGMTPTSLRISRDGTRALVSGQRGATGVLFVCAVIRDRTQVPVRLGPPLTVLPDLTLARSAAWLDQRRVVVLGRRGSGPEQPWKVEIGGGAEPIAAVPGAQGLTAGDGEIYAALPDGVAQLVLTTWVRVAAARWPAMPG